MPSTSRKNGGVYPLYRTHADIPSVMGAKTGPKSAVDTTPLVLPRHIKPSKGFEHFWKGHVRRKGKTGPEPVKLHPWQLKIVSDIYDTGEVYLAGLQLSRKNGKSKLCAALGLWDLFCGTYGANIVVCAVNEDQAKILFDEAVWMVENSPELAARAQIYANKIVVPGRSSTFRALPAEAKGLEGLLYSTAILDEADDADRNVFQTLLDAQGALERSRLILIGTPSGRDDGPLGHLREIARTEPDNTAISWTEFSADNFRDHKWDCEHCLLAANPAIESGYLNRKALKVTTPPFVTIARYRQRRLGQWITGTGEQWISPEQWKACEDGRIIVPGSDIVIAIDGSSVRDSTALVICSIEQNPILQLEGLWQPHLEEHDYRVPVLAVEQRIRELSDIYSVKEVTGDPAQGWQRTFSLLESEGFSTAPFANSPQRTVPAIAEFKIAVLEGELSHNGDARLAAHISNAVMRDKGKGYLIYKPSAQSAKKIDAAVTATMAHARSRYYWNKKSEPRGFRVIEMKR